MYKDFLTANLKVFFKKFFDTEISENDIEYVEHIIGDSDQMLPHIEEFIGFMINEKKI